MRSLLVAAALALTTSVAMAAPAPSATPAAADPKDAQIAKLQGQVRSLQVLVMALQKQRNDAADEAAGGMVQAELTQEAAQAHAAGPTPQPAKH